MFEIVMLIGFLAAGLAHLLPEEPKKRQPARRRQTTATSQAKQQQVSKHKSVKKRIPSPSPALAIFKIFQP